MPKTKVKNPVSADTVEMAAAEMIDEVYYPWLKQIEKLRRSKDGSLSQRNAVIELCTLSNIAEMKGKVMVGLLEEYLECHPEDDGE
ncbi:MAG: hypothetical protein ACRD18_16390 [Terriglobia bacterium]